MAEIHLSRVQEDLLRAVESAKGAWMSRSDITRFLEKKRFSNSWENGLKVLTEHGYIESERVPGAALGGYVWRYKIKS